MLTRWNNWGFGDVDRTLADFDVLRREMNRLFEAGAFDERQGRVSRAGAARFPRVSLFDRGAELIVRAEVPGMADADLDVTVEQGLVTLRGERKVEAPEGFAAHRQERGNMKFARSFTLPCRVDTEKATASLDDGVLTLALPKAAEAQPRQITIKTK